MRRRKVGGGEDTGEGYTCGTSTLEKRTLKPESKGAGKREDDEKKKDGGKELCAGAAKKKSLAGEG